MPSILPKGGACSWEGNTQRSPLAPAGPCRVAVACTVSVSKPLAYSRDQDHDAICAACEGKGFPGSSCSGGWGSRPGKVGTEPGLLGASCSAASP